MIGAAALAVALPALLFGWVSWRQPIHIDGAMNLQVAQRLVAEGEYARQYDYVRLAPGADLSPDWVREHPQEVQTNGPYVFVAAAALAVGGTAQLALQAANLLFVALAALAVWLLVRRRWPALAVVTPLAVLLVLPEAYEHALSGFGEIPGLSFLLLALVALAAAARTDDDHVALRWVTAAMLAGGLAVVTKTYLAATAPALLVGAALLVARRRLPWRSVLLRLPAYALPVAAFELYKLVNLGPSEYGTWWRRQSGAIGAQTSAGRPQEDGLEQSGGVLSRLADQANVLGERVGLPGSLLLALTAAVVVLSVVLLVRAWRVDAPSPALRAAMVVQAALVAVIPGYLFWWLVLVAAPKTFVRRTHPLVLAVLLALVLLAHLAASLREHGDGDGDGDRARTGLPLLRWVPGAVLVAMVALVLGTGVVPEAADAVSESRERVQAYEAAAVDVGAAPDDVQFHGQGFWSAPLVSLLAERPFRSLGQRDPCSFDPERDRLVWDEHALAVFGSPEEAGLESIDYELVTAYGRPEVVSIWRILPPDDCE